MKSLSEFTSSLSNETKWHGDHPEAEEHPLLRAGNLSILFDNGSLRYISLGNSEIIRMIYSAVRDKDWLTIKPVISDEVYDIYQNSFKIKYNCLYKTTDINFSARFSIEGNADNSLIFSMDGEALDTFEKNRIGFCLLHPIEGCAGKECIIVHSNDEEETLIFPELISPHQPFSDIKSMRWKSGKSFCSIEFYGDIFETEDQRNWTDASYKTYSTPLARPYPEKIQKGTKVSQKIVLKVSGDIDTTEIQSDTLTITLDPGKRLNFPLIGIGRPKGAESISDGECALLKNVRFDHYRVDLYLFDKEWRTIASASAEEADRLGYKLELTLWFDDNAMNQATDFIDWYSSMHPDILIVTLLHKDDHSTPEILQLKIAPLIKEALPVVKLGFGTNANFAQVNRKRPGLSYNDFICYAIHPQEHASDNKTLVETLKAQGDTVKSAGCFAKNKEVWVSPVNIKRRFNSSKSKFEQKGSGSSFPAQADSRLMSLFGASWAAGSVKYLSEAGVKGITYFETTGIRGIIQGDSDSPWPEDFRSVRGMIFPVYHLFNYLLKDRSFKIIGSRSSHPLVTDCLALTDGVRMKLVVSNFTSHTQNITIQGFKGKGQFRQLNVGSYIECAKDHSWLENSSQTEFIRGKELVSEPYSISFVDGYL